MCVCVLVYVCISAKLCASSKINDSGPVLFFLNINLSVNLAVL